MLIDTPCDGVRVVTLNRPERLNAVTMALQSSLDDALTSFESDPSVRCVVLTGAGEKAFTAGYDVHEMSAWSSEELQERLRVRERWLWHVASTPVPVIAALPGITYGVGALMAAAVDIRIGCPATAWKITAGEHGYANATWSVPDLVGRGRAAELLMTSRAVLGEEAERIGLLDVLVPASELLDRSVEMASAIAAHPPSGPRSIKRLLRERPGRTVQEQFAAEHALMYESMGVRTVGDEYAGFLADRASSR